MPNTLKRWNNFIHMQIFWKEHRAGRRTRGNIAAVILPSLVAGALLGWSLILACNAVDPCLVSREWDIMRDMGIAQSILDGRYPEDPVLAGEISWYNPLTGLMLLAAHFLTDIPLMRLAVVMGPYLNLLAPLAFYFFAASFFGRAAGLAGLCLMLFGKDGMSPYWTCAYSPWLLASVYSLGLLFITLAAGTKAVERKTSSTFLLAGLLLGITFLAHTAPAIIAGGTLLLLMLWEQYRLRRVEGRPKEARTLLGLFLLFLGMAFFVSLPYSGPILWRYQFHVLNPWPSLYASQNVELHNLPGQLWHAVSLRNGVALLGALAVFRTRDNRGARVVICWGLVSCLLMAQHYAWQALRLNDVVLPSVVPGHHAAIHLAAVRTVLFGVGAVALGSAAGRGLAFLSRHFGLWRAEGLALSRTGAWTAAVLAGLILYGHNPYDGRVDFQPPGGSAYYELFERHLPMYRWIRDHTPPDAVFLCPDENLGIQVVMPAGRKLVNPMLLYFNPYVERGPFTLRQEALLKALETGDKDALCDVAGQYPRLYVLLDEPVDKEPPFATRVVEAGGSVLYEIHYCWKNLDD